MTIWWKNDASAMHCLQVNCVSKCRAQPMVRELWHCNFIVGVFPCDLCVCVCLLKLFSLSVTVPSTVVAATAVAAAAKRHIIISVVDSNSSVIVSVQHRLHHIVRETRKNETSVISRTDELMGFASESCMWVNCAVSCIRALNPSVELLHFSVLLPFISRSYRRDNVIDAIWCISIQISIDFLI